MSPTASYVIPSEYGSNALGASASANNEEPISRTYQYRKVMKPMLERKRRARINRCLDELKELMVTALHSEGENVSKLEKADILELTVRHLHTLKQQHQLVLGSCEGAESPEGGAGYADRFRAGFNHCAQEVSQFLTSATPPTEHMEPVAGKRLLQHLGACVQHLDRGLQQQQQQQQQPQQQQQQQQYSLPATNYSPMSPTLRAQQDKQQPMWRPW